MPLSALEKSNRYRIWRLKNLETLKKKKRIWFKNNPDKSKISKEKFKKNHPDYSSKYCNYRKKYYSEKKEHLLKKNKEYREKQTKISPWKNTFRYIKLRCTDPSDPYYKKSIKNLITVEELKELWLRDKAHLLKWPSINKINPDGHYTFDNCQYIEFVLNCKKNRGGLK